MCLRGPAGRRCLGQPLRPWPLVGLHLVKGSATEVVAMEVVATEVAATEVVVTEVSATEVPATEVVRATRCRRRVLLGQRGEPRVRVAHTLLKALLEERGEGDNAHLDLDAIHGLA